MLETVYRIQESLYKKSIREQEHSVRVCELCKLTGMALNLSDDEMVILEFAGLLHDIGKINISDGLLNKPDKFSFFEYEEIKRHSEFGFNILYSFADTRPIAHFVLFHHERFDGGGYPTGISGEDIPFESRILAVADSYDAMISDRPYKKTLTRDEAFDELRLNSGVQFDPYIIDKFIRAVSDSSGQ